MASHVSCTVSPQVYERLQKVNLTMSHKSCIRLLTKLGDGFDARAMEWRDEITRLLDSSHGEVRFAGSCVIQFGV